MELLRALESIRTPFGDAVASVITLLGEETAFMLAGIVILWCINKRWGFRFLFVGLMGTALNQLLKAIFLVPRPWVLDPSFTIVESAREGAGGYSFPSGHTQSAVTCFGVIAAWAGKRWCTLSCTLGILLVGFSRMYLGVHTPLDVSVSLVTGVLTVIVLLSLFSRYEDDVRGRRWLGGGMLAFAAVLVAYVLLAPKGERNIPAFDADGLKSAWTLLGAVGGMLIGWWADRRYTHFETKAVWWAQLIKLVVGVALLMGVRVGLKPVLSALFGNDPMLSGIRYFVMAVVGSALWPMTFGFFAKLGGRIEENAPSVDA